jgi:Na+-transporting NADH:ubiquinone oxidoreductase subunit C
VSNFNREGIGNVLFVSIAVCLVCSIAVAGAAVALKPLQTANKELDRKENILRAAGLLPDGATVDAQGRSVDELFSRFQVRAVDLDTGQFTDAVDPKTYQPLKAARDMKTARHLTSDEDIATIVTRERYELVYLLYDDSGALQKVVMPVRGYGLWGTLYGYLALDGDLNTIAGLGFYDQKETPGLGGEVTNPAWKALWPGVRAFDAEGNPAVELVKNRSPAGTPEASHEVDALSGATLTTRGVKNLIRFWTGDLGFGPFLKNLQETT